MDTFDFLRLLGIIASFGILIVILVNTYETVCFSITQLITSYILIIYIVIVEILSLAFRKK